jgi:hypothetical protein
MITKKHCILLCFLALPTQLHAVCNDVSGYVNSDTPTTHPCYKRAFTRAVYACITNEMTDSQAISCLEQVMPFFPDASDKRAALTYPWLQTFMFRGVQYAQYIAQWGVDFLDYDIRKQQHFLKEAGNNVRDDDVWLRKIFASPKFLPQNYDGCYTALFFTASRPNSQAFDTLTTMCPLEALSTFQRNELLWGAANTSSAYAGLPQAYFKVRAGIDETPHKKRIIEKLFQQPDVSVDYPVSAAWSYQRGYFNISTAQKLFLWGKQHPYLYALRPDRANAMWVCVSERSQFCVVQTYYVDDFDFFNPPQYEFLPSILQHVLDVGDGDVIDLIEALTGTQKESWVADG